MEFRLSGEMELRAAGQRLDVGAPRQQAVLAALLVDAGQPVAIEALIDRVWDDNPPVEARNVLYSHLSRIRQLLKNTAARTRGAAVRIERRHAGYVLDVDPDLVDLHRFRRLIEQGRDQRRGDADRVGALGEALSLWRGPPLAGIPGGWATQVRDSWHRQRLDAAVRWAQVELRLGHPDTVIITLPDLVAEYPLVEPLEGLLMLALHATGRDAEALERYTIIRQRLVNDLGTVPGTKLRTLHQAILRGELPTPPPADQVVVASARNAASLAQLPPDLSGFTGRDKELHQLDGLLSAVADQSTAVVISAVSGTAGVGKTALAVHWAHRVREEFADGQLYVNLRGFDPTGSPISPAEAVRRFLDAFEVPPDRIPAGFEAQVGLYRSLLAHRRVLVMLDNARDAEQVRPLLPGAPACLVVVTSRNQLTGLVTEGAHPLTLDLLSAVEARELLARRLGARRVAAEPHAVDEIIILCARLPLALAIVAARAATHPEFDLSVLASELHEARGGLDEFAGADPATDARAVFSWSYLQLSPAAARLFRLLGLHPGPDVATPAAASLTGLPVSAARVLLAELAQAHLIVEHTPGRYSFHDLLRAYATERAYVIDSDVQRHAAIHRTLDHYLHTAHTADRLLDPYRDAITPAPHQPGVTLEKPADHSQAWAWFEAEYSVLLAIVTRAVDTGFDTHAWQLPCLLDTFFERRGHWHKWEATEHTALSAAQRLADPDAQGRAYLARARACALLGEYHDAHPHLQRALDIYQRVGDLVQQAHTHYGLAWVLEHQGDLDSALRHAQRALDLFQSARHYAGQARAANYVGWCYAQLGEHQHALSCCQRALQLHLDLGDKLGTAHTWDSLAYAHHHLDNHVQALACYRRAIALYQELRNRYYEAGTLARLGDTQHAMGDTDTAGATWRHALRMLDDLRHPDAEPIRAKLAKLGVRPHPRSHSATEPAASW